MDNNTKTRHDHPSSHQTTSDNHHSPSSHDEGGHSHHISHSAAEWAERLDAPERDAWQKPAVLVSMLQITPGQTVADIGAGTGYFLKPLSKAVGKTGRVLALDVEDDLIDYIRRRAERERLENVTAVKCPFDAPSLPPSGVSCILVVNTWHHISNRIAYGRKLAEGLTPDGVLYVVDFNKDATVGPPPEAKLAPEAVIEELGRAGFRTQRIQEDLPEQYVIRASLP